MLRSASGNTRAVARSSPLVHISGRNALDSPSNPSRELAEECLWQGDWTGSIPHCSSQEPVLQGFFQEFLPQDEALFLVWVAAVMKASVHQRSLPEAIGCLLGAELSAQDAFCFPHHLQAGLAVSSGVGSVHAFHVLLFRGHKPYAIGRIIDPIRRARRSWNYSSTLRCARQPGVQRWGDAKESR